MALRPISSRSLIKFSIVLAVFAVGILVLPRWGAALLVVIGLLSLVAAFDNKTGTFLPLAILFTITLTVLMILLGMMAFLHG
jgi:hypothetical protein